MFIDTHAHLYTEAFATDRAAVMARARAVCRHVLLPNIDLSTVDAMNALADDHPDFALPMLGLHPCHVAPGFETHLRELEQRWPQRMYWGVGETGLDAHWDTTHWREQKASLAWHAAFARETGKPLILHARKAFPDVADVVEAHQDGRLYGIFHCFSEGPSEAQRAVDLGFHLGLGGVLTFKNGGIAEHIGQIARDRIVLETDSPYLAPVPHRGKRNESAYIVHVAEKLAEIWQTSVTDVAETTSQNARLLFGLGDT